MKSRAFDLLGNFKPSELQLFQDWIKSSYNQVPVKIQSLGRILIKELMVGNRPAEITKQSLFSMLWPGATFNEYRINNTLSKLQEFTLQFLANNHLKKNGGLSYLFAAQELIEQDAIEFIPKTIKKIEQQQAANSHGSYEASYLKEQKFQLEEFYQLRTKPHNYSAALQNQMTALDEFYLIKKLRLACEMENRSQLVTEKYNIDYLKELTPIIESKQAENPVISIYFLCLKMLSHREAVDFQQLLDSLKESNQFFPEAEIRILYGYLLNFCISKINNGESLYYQKIFSIYKILIDSKLIFSQGYLSEWSFKNIVTTGIRIEAFDWTEDFIEVYKKYLPKKDHSNAVAYNLASLYFAQKNYHASLRALLGVEFTDPSYFLGAKIIQLKSYYELSEDEPFFSLIDSFNKYIRRNKKLSANRIKSNAHFLKLAKRLLKLKLSKSHTSKKRWMANNKIFEQQLGALRPLANKDWLASQYKILQDSA